MASKVERSVGTMFPKDRLTRLKASKTVLSMTPADLKDMEMVFSNPPQKVENKKVNALTTEDLVTLESLFSSYRMEVIANFQGVGKLASINRMKAGSSCCCCCTPCCCCTAAVEMDPFSE